MAKLKCRTVGSGYERSFTVGKVYVADLGEIPSVSDNESFSENDLSWYLESDWETVRDCHGDEDSAIVATFGIVEE